MAYHGCIPFMFQKVTRINHPKILEIGVDSGATYFSLLHFLIMTQESFLLAGIDIKIKDTVKIQSHYFVKGDDKQYYSLIEANSLQFLKIEENFVEFDLILVDGDHNYYTVSQELEILHDNYSKVGTTMIIDDYHGKWSEKDLFYSEREEGKDNLLATQKIETEKHGVKEAVDEFLKNHFEWLIVEPPSDPPGEPIVLERMC